MRGLRLAALEDGLIRRLPAAMRFHIGFQHGRQFVPSGRHFDQAPPVDFARLFRELHAVGGIAAIILDTNPAHAPHNASRASLVPASRLDSQNKRPQRTAPPLSIKLIRMPTTAAVLS